MSKISKKKRKWCIKQINKGKPKSEICKVMGISRMALWKIEKRYKKYGDEGLKDHVAGRPTVPLNSKFYSLVVKTWKENKCGARKLHRLIKNKGFVVSRRKIEQVMKSEGFQMPVVKRQKPRKYKRYEWPIPNYMWHCDWHTIKSKRLKGKKIIVYLDDCSRKIMGYCIGDETTKNSLFALYGAIADHQVIPFCLNSDRGAQFIPMRVDKKGEANHAFQRSLEELGILFIPSKRRHPQTNGKNERFFAILDREFDERFEDIDHFIRWYNNERTSEAVDYMTPNEAYKKRL